MCAIHLVGEPVAQLIPPGNIEQTAYIFIHIEHTYTNIFMKI
jgi:hypothetical protein